MIKKGLLLSTAAQRLLTLQLAAIAGGGRGYQDNCCQEEAHDEPWGRCPGMRPMRKWLFGRQPVAKS